MLLTLFLLIPMLGVFSIPTGISYMRLSLYIVYVQLLEGKATSRYSWLTPQFYSDSLQTLLNKSYNSLGWALTSPPKPHAFVSLPLQSLLGIALVYFISNSKVITYRFIAMFILANLSRYLLWGIPFIGLGILYTAILSFSSAYFSDLFVLIPSPVDLYNSFMHGKPLFDFKLIDLLPTHKISDNDINVNNSKPKPLYMNTDNGEGSSRTNNTNDNKPSDNSMLYSELSDKEYWEAQRKIYQDGLKALAKPIGSSLTDDEKYAVEQLSKINHYNKEKIENTIGEITRNINFPINDPEVLRQENLRLSLLRDSELYRSSFKYSLNNQEMEKSLVNSALIKLELLVDYNQKNHSRIGIKRDIPASNVRALTDAEIKAVVDKINNDPYAPQDVKNKVANGKINSPRFGPGNSIVKYLNESKK